MVVDFSSIPKEAIEKVKDCTTAEDVIELGKQYGIEISQDVAEAALAAGGEGLESLGSGGCKEDDGIDTCEDCKYYVHCWPYKVFAPVCRYGTLDVEVDPKQKPCEHFEKGKR